MTSCSSHQKKPGDGHSVHRDDGFEGLLDYGITKGGNGDGSLVHEMRPIKAQLIIVGLQEGPKCPQEKHDQALHSVHLSMQQAQPAETLVFQCPWTGLVINLTT